MDTKDVVIGTVVIGAIGYGLYVYLESENTPKVQTLSPTLTPNGVITTIVSSVLPDINGKPLKVGIQNIPTGIAPVVQTVTAIGTPNTNGVATIVDNSGTIVNGKFPPNAFSNVAFAAANGDPAIAGDTLLTASQWDGYRSYYSNQHGGCCDETLGARLGLFTARQYRAMLGK